MARLLRKLFPHLETSTDPLRFMARVARDVRAPEGSEPPGAPATEDAVVERARATVHSLLERLAAEEERARPLVEQLLALSPVERWQRVQLDVSYHTLSIVAELLRGAEDTEELSLEEAEQRILLALHLTLRAPWGDFPVGWVGDQLARGWLLLAEVALARRDLQRADFSLECARALLAIGSGDALLAFEVGLRWAFVDWASGRLGAAAAAFKVVGRIALTLQEWPRLAEAWIWQYLLFDQLGSQKRAAAAWQAAQNLLGPEAAPQALKKQIHALNRLGLHVVRPTPETEDNGPVAG